MGPLHIVYTVGHSSRGLDELLSLLEHLGIEFIVDVRRWPTSRKYPHFNRRSLEEALSKRRIMYAWMPELGGYRRFGVEVEDIGIARCFESEGFRAYATYILTSPEAKEALERLERLARRHRVAVMCSERIPWRCHRKIISDWLLSRGFRVVHIIDRERLVDHKPTRCADIKEGKLRYL